MLLTERIISPDKTEKKMKKKYVQPKMKTVKIARRAPLLEYSGDHSVINDTPGGPGNFK